MKTFVARSTFREEPTATEGIRVYLDAPRSSWSEPLRLHTQRGASYPKSPDGHAWGYYGSGPAQLALDLLWEVYGEGTAP